MKRFALAALVAAALLAGPIVADAAVATAVNTPIPKPVAPEVLRLPVATPSPAPSPTPVVGPPQNISTPTLWLRQTGGKQMIFSNINESMSDTGNGCLIFTITAPLNANDAVALQMVYNQNLVFTDANIYVGPVMYDLVNATIRSYSTSTTSARFTLRGQRTKTQAGSQMTESTCSPVQ